MNESPSNGHARELSVASFLDNLSAPQMKPGPAEAVALVGSLAGALASLATRPTPDSTPRRDTARDAHAAQDRMASLLDEAATPYPPAALFRLAEESAGILVLLSRILAETPHASRETLSILAVCAPLARAAADGAVQQVLTSLPAIGDDMERTTAKVRAQGLSQRVHQAEADFMRAMVMAG